jgi:hypothetical protein
MPDIFIYSKHPLGEARQDLEDDLESLLAGAGQCTGGGQGEGGWNIDLEVHDPDATGEWADRIAGFLRERPVPRDTFLVVWWSPERQSRLHVFENHDEA